MNKFMLHITTQKLITELSSGIVNSFIHFMTSSNKVVICCCGATLTLQGSSQAISMHKAVTNSVVCCVLTL